MTRHFFSCITERPLQAKLTLVPTFYQPRFDKSVQKLELPDL